jgi:hypothetical protein
MDLHYAPRSGKYQAGACNIGPAEIAKRRQAGLLGVAIAIALGALIVAVDAPAWARLMVFLPLAGGFVSLEQARRHFCVGFALAGLRNFGALGREEHVTDRAERSADRRAALVMTAYCSLLAAVVTLLFVALPI